MLMITMLIHAKIGCETIVQDYIKDLKLKKILKFSINFIILLSLLLSIVAIIKLNVSI